MGGAIARPVQKALGMGVVKTVPTPVTPTVAEVSQSEATSADGYDARKTKAKGRSSTIMTSSKGVEDETLTLGRKSLLDK